MSANSSSENIYSQENRSNFDHHIISLWEDGNPYLDNKSEIFQALNKFNQDVDYFIRAGLDDYIAGDYKSAINNFWMVLSVSPNQAEVYLYRGSTYFRLEEFKKASRDIEKYLSLVKEDKGAKVKLGLIYCNWGTSLCIAGEVSAGLDKLKKAIEINPRNIEAYAVRGHFFREDKDYYKALKEYKHALHVLPNDVYLLWARGQTFLEMGRYWFAIHDFEKAISIDPDFTKALESRQEALLKMGAGSHTEFVPHIEVLIGRNRNCDWVFTDDRISRTHAGIYQVGGKVILVDLGSSNGTFIGPKKSRILPYTPMEIKPESIIYLARKQKLDLSQLYYLGYEEFGG